MVDKHYDLHVRIGLNIHFYRKMRNLTQKELAHKISYSPAQIQRMETAKTAPTIDALHDIAEALNVTVEQLLDQK